MARRERGAYPLRSVTSEQRRQTPHSSLALRVASLFGLSCVARQSQTAAGMLLPRALLRPKINSNATPSYLFHRLKGNCQSIILGLRIGLAIALAG